MKKAALAYLIALILAMTGCKAELSAPGAAPKADDAAETGSESTAEVTAPTPDSSSNETNAEANPCDPSTGFLAKGSTELELFKTYNNPFYSLEVDPNDPMRLFVGSESNGIFRSEDGGRSWTWLRHGLRCGGSAARLSYPEIYDLKVDPMDTDVVYATLTTGPGFSMGDVAGLYKSTDGGDTWERHAYQGLSGDGFITLAVHPTVQGRLLFGMGSALGSRSDMLGQFFAGKLVLSGDGGGTLAAQLNTAGSEAHRCGFIDLHFNGANPNRGYVACSNLFDEPANYFLRTDDGGLTWSSPNGERIRKISSAHHDSDLVYALRAGSWNVQRSRDGGTTFEAIPNVYATNAITISPHDDQVIFISANETLYRTTDGFASAPEAVLTVVDPSVHASVNVIEEVVASASDPNIVYASARNERIYRSEDGGRTFTPTASINAIIEATE